MMIMRRFSLGLITVAVSFLTCSCTPVPLPDDSSMAVIPEEGGTGPQNNDDDNKTESMTIQIIAGGKTFIAKIEDSEAGKAFISKLPLTLEMNELNGNEKYCYGVSLPRSDHYFGSIDAGDLMLYSGNCIVLFYGSAGGYSYTRIGKLESTDGLAAALGNGSVSVRFEK